MQSDGFTLIELVVVLTILALLAGIVLLKVIGRVGTAKVQAARIQIEELGAALDTFNLETGRYPSTQEGLRALVEQPDTLSRWSGPYLKKRGVPTDPWGAGYHYAFPGPHGGGYALYSLGRDNQAGGEGEDADIKSWQ